MLQITIPDGDAWDEVNEEFIHVDEQILRLEHSLASLSKWEEKWCKPFLSQQEKTLEETIDYIRCMTLTQDIDPNAYLFITNEQITQINQYIEAPMTATWFSNNKQKGTSKETVTAELIYYWMIELKIPFECQQWHLNKLLTLVQVCNIKNSPPKKMSKKEIMNRNRALNEARRKRFNTKG